MFPERWEPTTPICFALFPTVDRQPGWCSLFLSAACHKTAQQCSGQGLLLRLLSWGSSCWMVQGALDMRNWDKLRQLAESWLSKTRNWAKEMASCSVLCSICNVAITPREGVQCDCHQLKGGKKSKSSSRGKHLPASTALPNGLTGWLLKNKKLKKNQPHDNQGKTQMFTND